MKLTKKRVAPKAKVVTKIKEEILNEGFGDKFKKQEQAEQITDEEGESSDADKLMQKADNEVNDIFDNMRLREIMNQKDFYKEASEINSFGYQLSNFLIEVINGVKTKTDCFEPSGDSPFGYKFSDFLLNAPDPSFDVIEDIVRDKANFNTTGNFEFVTNYGTDEEVEKIVFSKFFIPYFLKFMFSSDNKINTSTNESRLEGGEVKIADMPNINSSTVRQTYNNFIKFCENTDKSDEEFVEKRICTRESYLDVLARFVMSIDYSK